MSYLGSFDSVQVLPRIAEACSTSSLNHAKSHLTVKQDWQSEQTNKLDDGRMGSGFWPIIRVTAKQFIMAFFATSNTDSRYCSSMRVGNGNDDRGEDRLQKSRCNFPSISSSDLCICHKCKDRRQLSIQGSWDWRIGGVGYVIHQPQVPLQQLDQYFICLEWMILD